MARAAASVQHRAGKWQNERPGSKTGRSDTPLSLQFDKVQENFLSLEQQISTFQAHLEGLGKAIPDGSAGKFRVASSKTGEAPAEAQNSTSASASVPATDADADAPRSPLSFSSTIGRLHKSGRKK